MQWLADKLQELIQAVINTLWFVIEWALNTIADILGDLSSWLLDQLQLVLDLTWTQVFKPIWSWFSDNILALWQQFEKWIDARFPFWKDWVSEQFVAFADWLSAHAETLGVEVTIDDLIDGFNLLATAYNDAAWLLPLTEVASIVTGGLALVATIRLVRWIISFLWVTG